ncbi:flagellar assembly protein T N-terminal domain-containing protein [Paraglaciecola sp.]|uniref:flagella assembly protein FlgT n=1 Tax=Paraglaciecola sp. TaxID=1920173 RepID=UPI0030F37FD3
MLKICRITLTVTLASLLFSFASHAIWYESSGQAVIHNGNKQQARQQATQEAIKQALLFAGASISTIQHLTNGLLSDDSIEIRSSGEVDNIELIDEVYDGDILTVSIRADIFPQKIECRAADYQKSIVTTWYPIKHRQQATVGNLFDFGQYVAVNFQQEFNQHAKNSHLYKVEPYYLNLQNGEPVVVELAHKTNAQFVLLAEISELSTIQNASNRLAFWQSPTASRDFSLTMAVYDGNTGDQVFKKIQGITSIWEFDTHESLDPSSSRLWRSEFGKQVTSLLQNLTNEIDDVLSCLPAFGRVLYVSNDQININLGQQDGLREGDQLTLFQMSQFFDTRGKLHQQYQLHPELVTVTQLFTNTATVTSVSGAPLANIQANDFVARR